MQKTNETQLNRNVLPLSCGTVFWENVEQILKRDTSGILVGLILIYLRTYKALGI